jgi:hypothetical protein
MRDVIKAIKTENNTNTELEQTSKAQSKKEGDLERDENDIYFDFNKEFKDIYCNKRKKTAETDVGTIASNFKKIRQVCQERTGICIMDG